MRLRQFKPVVVICLVSVCGFAIPGQRVQRFIEGYVRFTNTGNPAKQATIELHRRGSRKILKIAKTDSTGHYRIENISPGLYRLKLRYKPGVCAETLDVDLRSQSEPEANILTEGC